MYDLAISPHGDLIMSGNRDLAGVSGVDLVNQRITIRLVSHRGTWFYDTDKTFGKSADSALDVDARVREALRPMSDIDIQDIVWLYDEDTKSLIVKVEYTVSDELDQASLDVPSGVSGATVVIPIIGG